jgi:hypothetical protein
MLLALWVLAVGLFFIIVSVFMRSVGAAFASRGVVPATRVHKICFCALGLIVIVKGILMLWTAIHT